MQKRATGAAASRRSRSRGPSLRKRIKTAVALLALAILSLIAIGLIYIVALFLRVERLVPAVPELAAFRPIAGTTIYYADNGPDGKPKVMAILAAQNRDPVHLKDISKRLIDATIAVEDSRFYQHGGVDYYGIGRAIVHNLTTGNIRGEGASTITQELARNMGSLGLSHEKSASRKLAEMLMAVRIEQVYTKDQILELYLNQIYYGNGAYGVEAAAQAYFHRSCRHLTLAQAAMLAGLPQLPSVYGADPAAAKQRRNVVLQRMADTGKITAEQCAEAQAEPLKIYRAKPRLDQVYGAPYFVQYVKQQLISAYGTDAVYSGWKVYTTLDSRIQDAAKDCLVRGIRDGSGDATQGCLVSLEPKTGYMRAMVGGVDYDRSQFNVVTDGARQPGSAFKPIVYAAAIDTGVCTLDSTYRDDPDFPWRGKQKKPWIPKNYGGRYSYRNLTVKDAIEHSVNTIAVKVAVATGIPTVIKYARRLGITTELDPYPTIALGSSSVRPIELCSAYSVFDNGGKRAIPTAILRVEDSKGDVVLSNGPEVEDTRLSPETIQEMNDAMRGVVTSGTGRAAASVPNACGKTGTTSNNLDAWFAGYTPELVTVVWAAHVKYLRHGKSTYVKMPGTTGGDLCAPIWRDFMLRAVPVEQAMNRVAAAPQVEQVDRAKPRPAVGRDEPGASAPSAAPAPDTGDTGDGTGDATQAPSSVNGTPGTGVQVPGAIGAPPVPVPAPSPPVSVAPSRVSVPPRTGLSSTRLAEPAPPRTDPGDEIVSVRLCAQTMKRATEWCPVTIVRRMRRRDIPGPCRVHRPPLGE